jgi:hypothetical protein
MILEAMVVTKEENGKENDATCPASDSGPRTHSPDGVDLTLIRWMLSMTPRQRLETLQASVASIMRLKHGVDPT